MDRDGYISYFRNGAGEKGNYDNCKSVHDMSTSFKKKYSPRVLPHINEEFQFRKTNQLLVSKIIRPKRDKIIMDSLNRTNPIKSNHHGKWSAFKKCNTSSGSIHKGHRIVNTSQGRIGRKQQNDKPSILQTNGNVNGHGHGRTQKHWKSLYSNPIQDNSYLQEGREKRERWQNKQSRQQKQRQKQRQREDKQNEYGIKNNRLAICAPMAIDTYGNGPTIIFVESVVLQGNPNIKPQTLLMLQLVERSKSRFKEEVIIRSDPVAYRYLSGTDFRLGVKFGIKVNKIGDFVPLRIWKYNGVDAHQLGVIDLSLDIYRYRAMIMAENEGEGDGDNDGYNDGDGDGDIMKSNYRKSNTNMTAINPLQQIRREIKRDGAGHKQREVVTNRVEGKLRKGKAESDWKVRVSYTIYPKKFKLID